MNCYTFVTFAAPGRARRAEVAVWPGYPRTMGTSTAPTSPAPGSTATTDQGTSPSGTESSGTESPGTTSPETETGTSGQETPGTTSPGTETSGSESPGTTTPGVPPTDTDPATSPTTGEGETTETVTSTAPDPVPSAPPPEPTATETITIVWNTPPAAESSDIPGVMIAVALAVLALAALVLALVRRSNDGDGARGAEGGTEAPDRELPGDGVPDSGAGGLAAAVPDRAVSSAVLTRFLITLGEGLIDCASPVAEVTRTLEEIARVNGFPGTQVIALPTAILVTVPGAEQSQTQAAAAGVRSFRLDQVEDVLQIAERARRGEVGPVAGMGLLQQAVHAAPPYPKPVLLGGYVVYSVGLALILGANLPDLLVAGVMGALVAVVQVATARTSGYLQALVVLTSAFAVSAVVFGLVRAGAPIDVLSSLVPPLVLFLPGAMLTTAVIDLATRQMIAGSARLAAGAMQLVLLALGISGAAGLVGVRASAIAEAPGQALGPLGPWLGVFVFVVGVALYQCVRIRSVPWVCAVVVVGYAGQVIGGLFFGGVMSALVGAAVMTPLALYAAGQRNGPPALVSFLPGFWVLVPGALGLVGVTQTLDGTATDGLGTIMTAGATMVAISLGVLVGIAVHGLALAILPGRDRGHGTGPGFGRATGPDPVRDPETGGVTTTRTPS